METSLCFPKKKKKKRKEKHLSLFHNYLLLYIKLVKISKFIKYWLN